MRDYAKIAPQFWTGETGRKIRRLGPEAVAIALYLLTCPHANAFGMYYLPLGYMACDVGMSPEGASEWLQKVCATGFCAYDEDAEVVWVRNMARFQIGEEMNPKDNRAKWIISEWLHLPKNVFLHDFYDVYGECFGLPSLSDERGFCNPSEAPSEAPSKPLRSLELEKELEKEENTNTASAPPLASPAAERTLALLPDGGEAATPATPAQSPEQALPEPLAAPEPTPADIPPSRPRGKKQHQAPPEGEPCYRAKSGRYLTGVRLASFDRFWSAFDFAKGKADAADAWLDIPQLASASPQCAALVDEICRAAALEARRRIDDTAKGKSPKWAQGWLTSRRWEDYEQQKPSAQAQAATQATPLPRDPTPEELEANRQRGLRYAQQMRERGTLPGGPSGPSGPSGLVQADFRAAMSSVAIGGQA